MVSLYEQRGKYFVHQFGTTRPNTNLAIYLMSFDYNYRSILLKVARSSFLTIFFFGGGGGGEVPFGIKSFLKLCTCFAYLVYVWLLSSLFNVLLLFCVVSLLIYIVNNCAPTVGGSS